MKEAQVVLDYFTRLSAIPRGSGSCAAVADWLMAFAEERGLWAKRDKNHSVLIRKPAAAGYETAPVTILQGHTDMVWQKEAELAFDFEKEGLRLRWDGDWLTAEGTTLGADNGIAVAMLLAVLAGDYPAPALECIFTSDEEIGLLGARGMDLSSVQGRRLINLDSEDEGILTVGCCGGVRADCCFPLHYEDGEGLALTLTLSGLLGGHSGMEIHRGRANANKLMGELLRGLQEKLPLRLLEAEGGERDNVIASCARYSVLLPAGAQAAADAYLDTVRERWKSVWGESEPQLSLTAQTQTLRRVPAVTPEDSRRVIAFLSQAPQGVQTMSAALPDLVQTSLNLGVAQQTEKQFRAGFCLRSSVTAEKYALLERLRQLCEGLGGTVETSGDYAAWEYREDSPLRRLAVEVFTRQYGEPPKLEVIHAGLECGVFCERLPGLDCVSLGPDLEQVHSVRERLSWSSTQRVWAYLLELLRSSR